MATKATPVKAKTTAKKPAAKKASRATKTKAMSVTNKPVKSKPAVSAVQKPKATTKATAKPTKQKTSTASYRSAVTAVKNTPKVRKLRTANANLQNHDIIKSRTKVTDYDSAMKKAEGTIAVKGASALRRATSSTRPIKKSARKTY